MLEKTAEDTKFGLEIKNEIADHAFSDASDHSDGCDIGSDNPIMGPVDDAPVKAVSTVSSSPEVKGKAKKKKLDVPPDGKFDKIVKPEPASRKVEPKDYLDRDVEYMSEDNIITVIEFSYVCPFRNRYNKYYCYYCKEHYAVPDELRQHTLTHDPKTFHSIKEYKKMPKIDISRIDCRLCDFKIESLEAFKTHIVTHDKKYHVSAPDRFLQFRLTWNDLTCVTCGSSFSDFHTLNRHMIEHFGNYTCDVCGLCFLDESTLVVHLKKHYNQERYACQVCGKNFKSKFYKDSHIESVHRKNATIPCPKCEQSFITYAQKDRHLRDDHGVKNKYPCNLCDKVYHRPKTLTEHHRRHHRKVRRHQCDFCEQKFYLPCRLKEHLATHTGERNFRCHHCDKSYPRIKSLRDHVKIHNDERFRCEVCGDVFNQVSLLRSHMRSHQCGTERCYFQS